MLVLRFFFFQAEDGIRDHCVTGVQTCALPICDDATLMRALLATKPRLNLRAHGETPIFYAARLKRLQTLELLIAAGADPTIQDDRGRDAVNIAKARRLPKPIIARLEQLRAGM